MSIPDIRINFNVKKFRISVLVRKLEAFLVCNNCELYEVKIIDGLMEPNLLANLINFVVKHNKDKDDTKMEISNNNNDYNNN